jgi:hypothetical protein
MTGKLSTFIFIDGMAHICIRALNSNFACFRWQSARFWSKFDVELQSEEWKKMIQGVGAVSPMEAAYLHPVFQLYFATRVNANAFQSFSRKIVRLSTGL